MHRAIKPDPHQLVEKLPDLAILVEPLLIVRRVLREQVVILHRRLLAIVRDDAVCRRLMTTPGVGPVVALTYRATEKHEPVSDIDTAAADSLKVLDPKRPIREADIPRRLLGVAMPRVIDDWFRAPNKSSRCASI
jgi:transposase